MIPMSSSGRLRLVIEPGGSGSITSLNRLEELTDNRRLSYGNSLGWLKLGGRQNGDIIRVEL